jgi:ubiquitin carboxyl-terminal hydrolase 14
MSQTQESFPPMMFLNSLRSTFPQFAQRARDGNGYAQQDAEEAWSQVVSQLRQKLKTSEGPEKDASFVDKYMAGSFESVMECDEPAAKEGGEEPIKSSDAFFKLNCHINTETSHLRDGLMNGLKEKIEKKSAVLDRDAEYTKTSRISRLPKYLAVHFMRFDWRRTTNKKAKIMRKVTFPQELDAVEFCTENLKKALIPVRDKIREIRKEEDDVERAKKKQRRMKEDAARAGLKDNETSADHPTKESKEAVKTKKDGEDTAMADIVYKTDAELEAERAASILAGKKELLELVDPKDAADPSSNHTGLYELRGIITHQGASADSGHYTAFVKKQGRKDPLTGKHIEEDGKWWWFNDDKVSEYEPERIETLSGGGKFSQTTGSRQTSLHLNRPKPFSPYTVVPRDSAPFIGDSG